MNQAFMTRKLLPPLAEGPGSLPLLLLLSFFLPLLVQIANMLLTCCNKCLHNSACVRVSPPCSFIVSTYTAECWFRSHRQKVLPEGVKAGRKHNNCVFEAVQVHRKCCQLHPRQTHCQLVRNKAHCATDLRPFSRAKALQEYNLQNPPAAPSSTSAPTPRVRFPFLSKSFSERDKSRQAGGGAA